MASLCLSLLVLLGPALPAQNEGTQGAALAAWETLSQGAPDGRQLSVQGLVLKRDSIELRLESGMLHFLPEVLGQSHGAVFLGRGSWLLRPASRSERHHLAMRLGNRDTEVVKDAFSSVFLLFNDTTFDELVAGKELTSGTVPKEASEVLKRWRKQSREHISGGLELQILQSRLNDEESPDGPFFALVEGQELEHVLLALDPGGVLDDEEVAVIVDQEQNGGYWYSSHLEKELQSGTALEGHPNQLVDAQHYSVHTKVVRGTELEATTSVRLTVLAAQVRLVPFSLAPTLRIQSAHMLAGDHRTPLQVIQVGAPGELWNNSEAAVVCPHPVSRGETVTLEITYAGKDVLQDQGVGIYAVRARTNWYPKIGGIQDRATYDLTFVAPKDSTVIAVGNKTSEKTIGNQLESKWQANKPITVAGFNYGDFKRFDQHEPNTKSDIEVWASTGTPDIIKEINMYLEGATSLSNQDALAVAQTDGLAYVGPSGPSSVGVSPDALAESALADGVNALQVLTAYFGPLPYNRLALTQQAQWGFGQAWPTLVYLPYLTAMSQMMGQTLGIPGYGGFAEEVGYHEIAHQWWGHKIGWQSYRDQWLSEGFAEFSTALMVEVINGPQAYDDFWEQRRKDIVSVRTGSDLAPFQAGGITMGFRVRTARAPTAYSALSYSKGAYVLHMLRMTMRDKTQENPDTRFFTMLKDFAETYSGASASTADFQRMVEKHMVPELNFTKDGSAKWFFDQWVRGTQVPSYDVDMKVEKMGGKKFRLHGTVRQSNVSEDFVALVPVYVDLGKGSYGQFGRAPFQGTMEQAIDVTLELPKKPKGILVNALHEVLSRN